MGNTESDLIVGLKQVRTFFSAISENSSSLRTQYWIPRSEHVLHNQIGINKNPKLDDLRNQINSFLSNVQRTKWVTFV